jgi:hypothetical protein
MNSKNIVLHELCYAPNLPQMTLAYQLPDVQMGIFATCLMRNQRNRSSVSGTSVIPRQFKKFGLAVVAPMNVASGFFEKTLPN